MVTALIAIVLFVLFIQMVTLGAVLLTWFVLGRQSRARRVFVAVMCGPLAMIVPTFALIYSEQGNFDPEQFVGIGLLLAIGAMVAWPVAHFATRRLDRLTQFDPQVFE